MYFVNIMKPCPVKKLGQVEFGKEEWNVISEPLHCYVKFVKLSGFNNHLDLASNELRTTTIAYVCS